MLSKNTMVLVKIEGSYAGDPTPTTADNFLAVHNVKINRNLTYNDTQANDGSISPRAGTLGQKYIEFSFDHELQVNNSAQTVPPCDPVLLACGFSKSSGVYTPRTTSMDSCTFYVYEEDVIQHIHGCRGNLAINLNAGQNAIFSFTMQGLYEKPADTTFPVTWTDNGGAPLVAINQAFAYHSTAFVIDSLTVNMNNTLTQSPNMDDAVSHGINSINITDRNPEGSFDPEMFKSATYDIWTVYEAVDQKALTYVLSNGTAKLTISVPKTELMNIQSGDRSGTRIYEFPFRCVRNTGDDEVSLTFAAA